MRWNPLSLFLFVNVFVVSTAVDRPEELFKIGARTTNGPSPNFKEVSVFKADNAIFYRLPLMNIDLDGAPNAYHPPVAGHPHGNGPHLGLDDLRNASKNLRDGPDAEWVGIVTDGEGKPLIQKQGAFAGFYVSPTALQDLKFPTSDPRRYVDATTIPYVVLNPILRKKVNVEVGDLAVIVMNLKQPKIAFGIVADIGPSDSLGECSKALAVSLGIPLGVEHSEIFYIFFPTPAQRTVRTPDQIQSQAAAQFNAWGGISRLQSLR